MRPPFPGQEGVGFRCEVCGALFPDLAGLQRHVLSAHAGPPLRFSCGLCGRAFDSPSALDEHLRSAHRAAMP